MDGRENSSAHAHRITQTKSDLPPPLRLQFRWDWDVFFVCTLHLHFRCMLQLGGRLLHERDWVEALCSRADFRLYCGRFRTKRIYVLKNTTILQDSLQFNRKASHASFSGQTHKPVQTSSPMPYFRPFVKCHECCDNAVCLDKSHELFGHFTEKHDP